MASIDLPNYDVRPRARFSRGDYVKHKYTSSTLKVVGRDWDPVGYKWNYTLEGRAGESIEAREYDLKISQRPQQWAKRTHGLLESSSTRVEDKSKKASTASDKTFSSSASIAPLQQQDLPTRSTASTALEAERKNSAYLKVLSEFAMVIVSWISDASQQYQNWNVALRRIKDLIIQYDSRLSIGEDSAITDYPIGDYQSYLLTKIASWLELQKDIVITDLKDLERSQELLNALERSGFESQRVFGVDEGTYEDYYQTIMGSSSFPWLQQHMEGLQRLSWGSPVDLSIGETIARECREARGTIHGNPRVSISLDVPWSLAEFVQTQKSAIAQRGADPTSEVVELATIENAITLTEMEGNVQALTCGEYLDQVWPQTGRDVLNQMKLSATNGYEALKRGRDLSMMFPGIDLLAILSFNDRLSVCMIGDLNTVIKICKIVLWIASALSASPEDSTIYTCSASIKPSKGTSPRNMITSFMKLSDDYRDFLTTSWHTLYFDIKFTFKKLAKVSSSCWHEMFNNPVVVTGYPIPRRPEPASGLEISLDIISAVLRTDRVATFDKKLYIKAFSSMLVPTRMMEDVLLWHYIYEPEGKYLWYSQDYCEHLEDVKPELLPKYRHIVGWSSNARITIGSPRAYLTVAHCGLEQRTASFALKGFNISGGKLVSVGASVSIGHKDPSLRVEFLGKPIIDKLEWAAGQFVVLWDTSKDRGWLVDGLSVLLYMLRVYLDDHGKGLFKSTLLLDMNDLYEPDGPYPLASADFFVGNDWKNMKLRLSRRKFESWQEDGKDQTKESFVLLQDRVEDLMEILFSTIELQTKLSEREGVYYKGRLGKYLEGWDFKSLATKHFQFEPVAKSFPCLAMPWVDFIRSINAVVLFGRFGDFIESPMPKGLGACVSTLRSIVKEYGEETHPVKLTSRYLWCNPDDTTQVIWPVGIPRLMDCKGVATDGSVVFGQHPLMKWFRTSDGTAYTTEPSQAAVTHVHPVKPTTTEEALSTFFKRLKVRIIAREVTQ